MARVLDDPDLRGALGEEGLARSRALLKWDSERSRLLAAYQLALADPQTKDSRVTAARPVSG